MTTTSNALHAAAVWLERIQADPTAIVVVTIRPTASVGLWKPGVPTVPTTPIDDAAAELCEAVAPAVEEALAQLAEDAKVAAVENIARGAKLQALIDSASEEIDVRLVLVDGTAVALATLVRDDPTH